MTSHRSLILIVSLIFVLLNTDQAFTEALCCDTCIGKDVVEYYYDPIDFNGCQGGNRSCCFNDPCKASSSSPTLLKAEFGEENPSIPQVKAGEWIQMTWPNMSRVTYEFYKPKQKKITTVRNGSHEAIVTEDYFLICPTSPGKIVTRGWGKDSCTTATLEFYIDILEGNVNQEESCIKSSSPPMTQKALNDDEQDKNQPNCNPQGSTIEKKDNGDYYCKCTFEWAGEKCDQYPWWKIVATIGGVVAAALSIAVSVKAFLHARNKKKKQNQEGEEEEETSPDEGSSSIYIVEEDKKKNKNKRKSFQDMEETIEMNKSPGENISDYHKQIEPYIKKKSMSNECTL